MRTVATIADLRAELDGHRAAGRTVGFVPTMGYLHDGHASLMRTARERDDVVVTVDGVQLGIAAKRLKSRKQVLANEPM